MHINRSTTNTVSICFVECNHIFCTKVGNKAYRKKAANIGCLQLRQYIKISHKEKCCGVEVI